MAALASVRRQRITALEEYVDGLEDEHTSLIGDYAESENRVIGLSGRLCAARREAKELKKAVDVAKRLAKEKKRLEAWSWATGSSSRRRSRHAH